MPRKAPLTDKQWESIGKRFLAGEGARALAREYKDKITESAIRKRFGARVKEIKTVANQLVAAETAFEKLPLATQIEVRTFADRLKAVGDNMLNAAVYSSDSASRLSRMANRQLRESEAKEDSDPERAEEFKRAAAASGAMANLASQIPMALIAANRDASKIDQNAMNLSKALEAARKRIRNDK